VAADDSVATGGTIFFVPVVAVSAAARPGEPTALGDGETFGAEVVADIGVCVCVCVVPPPGGIAMGLVTPANVAPARRLDAALAAAAILRATSAALGAAGEAGVVAAAGAGAAADAIAVMEAPTAKGVAPAAGVTPAMELAPAMEVAPAVEVAPATEVAAAAPTFGVAGFNADAVGPPEGNRFVVAVVELASAPAFGTLLTVLDRGLVPTPAVEGERVFAVAPSTAAAGAAETGVATGIGVVAGAASARDKVPTPLVPSTRAGPPGSATPSRISGSSRSPDFDAGSNDADDSVGTNEVSGRASNPGAATAEAAGRSAPRSSNAPCDSKSSSASAKGRFEGAAAATAGAGAEEERPDGSPIPIGSSTGRSAKGSNSEREAASIVSSRIRAINPERILQCHCRGT